METTERASVKQILPPLKMERQESADESCRVPAWIEEPHPPCDDDHADPSCHYRWRTRRTASVEDGLRSRLRGGPDEAEVGGVWL